MKIFILLIMILYAGCRPRTEDLGGGYVLGYNNNSLDRVILINSSSGGINLKYYEGTNKIDRYFKNGDWIVDSYVAEANADDKFVLIDQKPIDSICECNQTCKQLKFPNDRQSYKLCKEAIEKATIHLFYIIDKTNNTLYGPMSKRVFSDKILQLNVNSNLRKNLF